MSDANLDEAERIFSGALELPTEARAAFIDEQCTGNRALKAEIERLLRADVDVATVAFPSPAVWLPPDTLAAGQIVADRYRRGRTRHRLERRADRAGAASRGPEVHPT